MDDNKKTTNDEPEEGSYKLFGCWEVKCLQRMNNAKGYLLIHSLFAIVAAAMSGGIANINVSSIEKRFGLNSSESALIVVGYDISFCVLALFVSYFGQRFNRARLVAIGCATYGLGSLIYALPHFTTGLYQYGTTGLELKCDPSVDVDCSVSRRDSSYNMYILLVGQLLLGAGATPLYTLGLAYIEDSVSKRSASIYLGIANAAAALGPVIGFTVGGVFLKDYFVDFDKVPASERDLLYYDPRWIGAWWLFPMCTMAIAWVIVFPLAGFPKHLPGTSIHKRNRETEVHESGGYKTAMKAGFGESYKDIPTAIFTLLRNPTYVFITLAGCLEVLNLAGSAAFITKFFENAFHLSLGDASLLTGAVTVSAGVVGNVIGGMIIYGFKLKTPAMLKFSAASMLIVAALSSAFLFRCDNIDVAGVNTPYGSHGEINTMSVNLTSSCNSHCNCQEEFYVPVCGADNITYFSPCQAGCLLQTSPTIYANCSCIEDNLLPDDGISPGAISGYCSQTCNTKTSFYALSFFFVLFAAMVFTPLLVTSFRVVPESMRSFAIGLQFLLHRGLGTIPGPNMYGAFFDSACVLWQTRQCDGTRGSCWIYNNNQMALAFLIISAIANLIAMVSMLLAAYTYKPLVVEPMGKGNDEKDSLRLSSDTGSTFTRL